MQIKTLLLITISAVLIGGALLIVANKPYAEQFVIKNKVVPISEKFTELFIDGHEALPRDIKPEERYFFKFTVHNLERRELEYPYIVTAKTESGEEILTIAKGVLDLKYEEEKTVHVPFILPARFRRAKIEIKLLNKNQTIHFWVNELSIPIEKL